MMFLRVWVQSVEEKEKIQGWLDALRNLFNFSGIGYPICKTGKITVSTPHQVAEKLNKLILLRSSA